MINDICVGQEDSILDATEDDQLQAAIQASLTEVSKPASADKFTEDSDSESSELETFTDSEDENCPSPAKTRKTETRSQTRKGSCSPTGICSPRRYSEDSESKRKSNKCASPKSRRLRERSPLATASATTEECLRSQKKNSPQRKLSPQRTKASSPVLGRKQSPGKTEQSCSESPHKKDKISNNVHPAVIENIRRNSVSEDDVKNVSNVTEQSTTSEAETVESDKSTDTVHMDSRDYRRFLGPESGKQSFCCKVV